MQRACVAPRAHLRQHVLGAPQPHDQLAATRPQRAPQLAQRFQHKRGAVRARLVKEAGALRRQGYVQAFLF